MFIIRCAEDLGITILDASAEERLLSTIVTRQRSPQMDLSPPSPLGALSCPSSRASRFLPCFFSIHPAFMPEESVRHNPVRHIPHTCSDSSFFVAHGLTHLVSLLSSTRFAYSTIIPASFLPPYTSANGELFLACD